MYSVVLMVAMAGGTEAPAGLFDRWSGGGGCGGCVGAAWQGGFGCSGAGCGGCDGCGGCFGCDGGAVPPDAHGMHAAADPAQAAPATIVVHLPAEARLRIDGEAMNSTSARRVFTSPALAPGKEYTYTLKAEFNQGGKPVVVSKDVTVRAGQETSVTLRPEVLPDVASR